MRQKLADYRVFWQQFRDAYHSTGAVLPSGRALSRALARYVRDNGEAHVAESLGSTELAEVRDAGMAVSERLPHVGRRILEVGPGTGAVTSHIADAMRPSDQLVLVERNEQFVTRLRERLSNDPVFAQVAQRITLVHASIESLPEDQPYDLIISGLPLNNFAVETVKQILAKLRRLLAPGGTLSFFEYIAIRRAKSVVSSSLERQRLRGVARALDGVLRGEVHRDSVFCNVPPAWVHHVRFQ